MALLILAITGGLGIVLLLLIPLVGGLVISALVRRGVPQRLYAAWRTRRRRVRSGRDAAGHAQRRPRAAQARAAGRAPDPDRRPRPAPARHPARERPRSQTPVWEQVAGAWPAEDTVSARSSRPRHR